MMKNAAGDIESRSSLVVPVLISSVVGAGLALLLTPKSGRDIRSDIKKIASRGSSDVSSAAENLYSQGREALSSGTTPYQESNPASEGTSEIAGNDTRSLLLPILVSGAVGAAVALLFAPKSGSEVWVNIKDFAADSWDKMASAYQEAKGSAKEAAGSATEKMKQAA